MYIVLLKTIIELVKANDDDDVDAETAHLKNWIWIMKKNRFVSKMNAGKTANPLKSHHTEEKINLKMFIN